MILNKANILQGTKQIQKIKLETLQGEIYLKPLTSAEVNEILQIEAQGYGKFKATNNNKTPLAQGEMDLAKMQKATAEAHYEAIHKSINNEKNPDEWTIEELQQLPQNTIDEIYEQVMDISGANITEADINQFPENK